MNLTFHSTGLAFTLALKAAAQEKFGRLGRLVARYESADPLLTLELARTTHHHHKGKIFRVEAHLVFGKQSVYAAAEGDELHECMDHCVAAVKKQLVRLKERTQHL